MRTLTIAGAAALALGLLAFPTETASEARLPIFTADREACFGRVYDRGHLASHPLQKVTSLHILRSLAERSEAENWQPNARAENIKKFRESGTTEVSAFVTFRDRRGYFHNSLNCNKENKDGVSCYIECDGGSFLLKRQSANSVLLDNGGFVLIGGCGDEVEEGEELRFEPGKDDKLFRLDSKPVAVCRAEEQKAIPIRAGKPLRERFKEDEPFCFGRDYDPAHLASHPQQLVASLRVGRLDPAKELEDDPDPKWWWYNVRLDVALTLRAGGAATTARYWCTPQEGSWECRRTFEGENEGNNACIGRSIHLVRGPGDDIFVHNRRSGLPINDACATSPATAVYQDPPPLTRSDDKVFRLSRMPVAACRP